jgi:hypothetical protein
MSAIHEKTRQSAGFFVDALMATIVICASAL